jgi:hypothetical protein
MRFKPKRGPAPWLRFWFIAGLVLIGNLGIPSLLTAGQVGPPGGPPAASPAFIHTPPTTYQAGEKLRLTAMAGPRATSLALYYRTPGLTDFQARPMVREAGASYVFELDTAILAAAQFEYYLQAETVTGPVRLPDGAPARTYTVASSGGETPPAIPQDLPTPQAEESRFPLHANGSLQHSFSPGAAAAPATSAVDPLADPEAALSGFSAPPPATPPPSQNGNIQIAFGSQSPTGFGLQVNANTSLTDNPLPGAGRVDLTSMNVSVSLNGHVLRAGDLNLNESEFSAYGLGRRGIEYAYDNRKLYFHAFDVTTQQLMSFKGFGVPKSGSSLMGAAAGFSLFQENFTLRAIALSGKDDPSLAANVVGSPFLQSREGLLLALTQETKLFAGAVDLKAEYARSSYDADLNDGLGRQPDQAWSAGGTVRLGSLTLGTVYRSVGRNFNSIGLQYVANDRSGWDSSLFFSLGPINLQGQFVLQRDNIGDDPARPTTKSNGGLLNLSLNVSSALSLTLGGRLSGQSTTFEGLAGGQDTATNEGSAGVNLTISPAFMLNFAATFSDLRSRSAPESDSTGLTLNVGGSIRAGEWLTLMPTVGLTRYKTRLSGELNTTMSAMLTGEVFLFPRVLSLLMSGAFNRMEMSVFSLSNALDVMGGINFYLGQLIHVNNLLLTVRGSYRRNEMSGLRTTESRILAQTDFAF